MQVAYNLQVGVNEMNPNEHALIYSQSVGVRVLTPTYGLAAVS